MTKTKTKTMPTRGPPALLVAMLACACGESSSDTVNDGGDAASDVTADGDTSTDSASTGNEAGSTGSDATADGSNSAATESGSDSSSDSSDTPTPAVALGSAGDFVVLAKSGISVVPPAAITGDIGLSPAAATYITGFSLVADATNAFATSVQVTGRVYASDYEPPTPTMMTTAISDMELAFTDAAGRAPDVTELGAGEIGGMTLAPGTYAWGTGLAIASDVVLDGSATDVWIFQIAQDLTIASGTAVVLEGGAVAEHVVWQVSGKVELGTTAHAEGIVLAQTSITLATGASMNGRLFAQTAVELDGNAIVAP